MDRRKFLGNILKVAGAVGLGFWLSSDNRPLDLPEVSPEHTNGADGATKFLKTEASPDNPYHAYHERHDHKDTFLPFNEESIENFGAHTLKLLQQYSGVDQQTADIVNQTVGRLGFTAFVKDVTIGELRHRGGQELVMVLYNEKDYEENLGNQQVLFAYHRGTGLVSAPLIDCPDKILAPMVVHELGHLVREMKALAADTQLEPVGSSDYYQEEVKMTEMQGQLMDAGVKGGLMKLLDKIIDKSGAIGKDGKFSFLEKTLTNSDLLEFEKMFGLEQSGKVLAAVSLSIFQLMLEFRYIDRSFSGPAEGAMVQKIARYRRLLKR